MMVRLRLLAVMSASGIVGVCAINALHHLPKAPSKPLIVKEEKAGPEGTGGGWLLGQATLANPNLPQPTAEIGEWKPRYQPPSHGGAYTTTSSPTGSVELQQFDQLLGGIILASSVGTIFSPDETESPYAPGGARAEDAPPNPNDPVFYSRQEGAGMNMRPIWTQYIVPQSWPTQSTPTNWDVSASPTLVLVHLDGRQEVFATGPKKSSSSVKQTWYSTQTVDRFIDLTPSPTWTAPPPVTTPSCCPGQGACMLPQVTTCPGNTGGSATPTPSSPECKDALVLHEIGDEMTGPGNHDVYFNLYVSPDYLPAFTFLPDKDQVTFDSARSAVFQYSYLPQGGEFQSLTDPLGDNILTVTWGTPCAPSGGQTVFPGSCLTGNEQDFVALVVATPTQTNFLYYQHGSACDSGAPQQPGCNSQGAEYHHDFLAGIATTASGVPGGGGVSVADQLSYDASGRYLGHRTTAATGNLTAGFVPATGIRSAGHVATYSLDANQDSIDSATGDTSVRPCSRGTFTSFSLTGITESVAMQLNNAALPASTLTYSFSGSTPNVATGLVAKTPNGVTTSNETFLAWDPVTNGFASSMTDKDVDNITHTETNNLWNPVPMGSPWQGASGIQLSRPALVKVADVTSGGAVGETLSNRVANKFDSDGRVQELGVGPSNTKVDSLTYTSGPGNDVYTDSSYSVTSGAQESTTTYTYYPLGTTPNLGGSASTDFWHSAVKTATMTLTNGLTSTCSFVYESTWPYRVTSKTCTDADNFTTVEAWAWSGTTVTGSCTHTVQTSAGANLEPSETTNWSFSEGYDKYVKDIDTVTDYSDPLSGNVLSEQAQNEALAPQYDPLGALQSESITNPLASGYLATLSNGSLDPNGNPRARSTSGTTGGGGVIEDEDDLSSVSIPADDSCDFTPTMMKGWSPIPPSNPACACNGSDCYVPEWFSGGVPVAWPDTAMVCCHAYTNSYPAIAGPGGTTLLGGDPGPDANVAYVSKRFAKKQPWNPVSATFGGAQSQVECSPNQQGWDTWSGLTLVTMEPATACTYWTQTSHVDGSPANPPTSPWTGNAVLYSKTSASGPSAPGNVPPGIPVIDGPVNGFQGGSCGGPAYEFESSQVPMSSVSIQISPYMPENPANLLLPWKQDCLDTLVQNVAGEYSQNWIYIAKSCWIYNPFPPPPGDDSSPGQSCNINPAHWGAGYGESPTNEDQAMDGCCNYYMPQAVMPNGCTASSSPVDSCN